MLRQLYVCALRWHPTVFRDRFAGEMLFIFDQQTSRSAQAGLVVDGLISLFRQWALRAQFRQGSSPLESQVASRVPSFYTIDPFRPRTVAAVNGIIVTAAVFCMTCFAIRYSWIRVLHIRISELRSESSWSPPITSGEGPGAIAGSGFRQQTSPPQSTTASAEQTHPIQKNSTNSAGLSELKKQEPEDALKLKPIQAAQTSAPNGLTTPSAKTAEGLTKGERRVVDVVAADLAKDYVDPVIGQQMSAALLSNQQRGDYDREIDGIALARLLTSQLREISHDQHLEVVYSPTVLPVPSTTTTTADSTRYRMIMKQQNCTFEKVQILPHNLGYLKLNSFPDLSVCGSTAVAAMKSLNRTDALIFDLRENRGGQPEMVATIAAYLFDHPEYWYNPRENTSPQSWTRSPVAGNKLSDKPVYILTSTATISAAEQFCYNLKMLKRATLIGETTAGAAHAAVWHRIDDHFGIAIPETKAINPFSSADWEGTGVEPDVKVKSDDALQTAEKLARTKLQKTPPSR